MKYLRTFATSFMETAGHEIAVGTVWIWRGLWFGGSFLLVMKAGKALGWIG